ncbi:lantibiotic dehydratase [Sphaerisporangium fuscum]|uniref:lantibiotic dehydratase n=1 Tax=Sphaerisporangium fuscum TaxID=2835868 RepID=UPI002029B0FC|nr:lantibiotic dehydratase [Sphaerisporangium fuscum]
MGTVPRDGVKHDGAADPHSVIRQVQADPLLREAIRVASGSLSGFLDKFADGTAGNSEKKLLRAAISATRYRLRMGGRPTPFGLFAGVAAARFGPEARAEVRGPGEKSVRLDGDWLLGRVRAWLELPAVRRRVHVMVNDLCFPRDGRLFIRQADGEISIRDTPVVAWIRETAASPVPYPRLLRDAAGRFPDVPEDRIDGVLAQLIRHGFLVTSITPHLFDAHLLDRLEAALGEVPGAVDDLRGIRSALDAYRATEPGKGEDEWLRLVRRLDPAGTAPHPPVHVDLAMDATVVLPRQVADEARRYAHAMWAISPEWVTHGHMREYWDRFVERYGVGDAVPLAELVDPHRGLGLPASYLTPPSAHAPAPTGAETEQGRERRALIAELVQEALLGERRELVLTEADIDRLSCASPADPPRTLELCFQLLADSVADLNRGEFRLLSALHAGSWMAGATAGRFAALTGMSGDLSRIMASGAGEAMAAQVSFRPLSDRGANLVQVPRLLPYEIPVGVFADREDPHVLDWRELLATATPTGFQLVWGRDGRQVIPVVPHMLALDREAPAIVRLLVDMALGAPKTLTGWDWAGLASMPFLPRLSFGRVVAAPQRWKPDRRVREAAADPAAWASALARWRDRYQVPDRVQIVQQDRVYGIDLRDDWHQRLLRHELTKGRLLLVEDVTAGGRGLGWAGGHSTEVVVPMTRRDGVAAARRPSVRLRPREEYQAHLPGEEWLYAKLYAVPEAQDPLLRDHLPQLLREIDGSVDRWFFIRYLDPDPHIRLRLHGDPEALRATVLPALARHCRAWQRAGAMRALTLDTYEPETGRYGGPAALPHAERLFCLDSQSVIAQLRARARGGPAIPDEVLTAAGHAILLESLGDWDWCAWVERTFRKGPEHATFQRHRALATDLIRPGRTAERVAERLSLPGLARLWTGSPEARAYGAIVLPDGEPGEASRDILLALLHMQHNRLIGVDRAKETAAAAILRGVARAHTGRLRHGAGLG